MFSTEDKTTLLRVARESITWGFRQGSFLPLEPDEYSPPLARPGASFVTLKDKDVLRGCVGALLAYQPLCADVSEHAWAAAFSDQRFNPVEPDELETLSVSISVLSESEPICFSNERDLLSQLRPHQDGLILREGSRHATFLPSVWDSLSSPEAFLGQLKHKAGLAQGYWSDSLQVFRYSTESFSDDEKDI